MSVAASLVITGTGRYADTYEVTVSGNQWGITYPNEVGPIGPGESASFPVIVQIPRDVQGGVSDTINLLVKSRGDSSRSAAATLVTTSWRNLFYPFITTWFPW
jgi:hypothetical protein